MIYTRDGHPAIVYAGRQLGLEVIAWQDAVSQHCRKHSDDVLQQLLLKDAYSTAKKKAAQENVVTRVSHGALQFIEVALTPSETSQVIRVTDVQIEEARSNWRTGANLSGSQIVSLEEKMGLLLAHELDHYGLFLAADPVDKTMGIFTKQSIAEGAKIMDLAALIYTDGECLQDFLSDGGNRVLSTMLLSTKDIQLAEDSHVSLRKAN